MEVKTCTKCSVEKTIEQFSLQSKATGKRSTRCKECMATTIKEHYQKYKQQYAEKSAKRRASVMKEIVKLKESKPCMDCGRQYPYYVMDFDHRDRAEKKDGIARLIRSEVLGIVLSEIAKCDLVCSNCHRIRTHTRKDWDLAKK